MQEFIDDYEPIKRSYDKERNRFMKLRYYSDSDEYPDITATELAHQLGSSQGTISSLEDPSTTEKQILSKRAGLFKAYHDYFNCSYEYLFGEAKLPKPKYASIPKHTPLENLDQKSVDSLEQLLNDDENKDVNTIMLKALLAEPEELSMLLDYLFNVLYVINNLYANSNPKSSNNDIASSSLWFTTNSKIDSYLKETVLPHLHAAFLIKDKAEEANINMYQDSNTSDDTNITPVTVTKLPTSKTDI